MSVQREDFQTGEPGDAGTIAAAQCLAAARRLEAVGRFEEALAVLGPGLEAAPGDIELINAAGVCLVGLGRADRALDLFRLGVELAPASDAARFGLGVALALSGAVDAAAGAFRDTLALNPDHAGAMVALAELAESRGEAREAEAYARRALARDAADPAARVVLAKLALVADDFAGAERTAREAVASPDLPTGKRADARFVLADALDGSGRFPEAFAEYAAANAEVRELFAGRFDVAGYETAAGAAERVLAEFLATPADRWGRPSSAGSPGPASGHAFLFGFPRSGTTLLENVLGGHPGVVCLEERLTLHDAGAVFLAREGGVERLSRAAPGDLTAFQTLYWRRVGEFGLDPTDRVFIDKQPLGGFLLPLVAKMFPGAKIILALRDPRDVVLSCFRRNFEMNASMFEFTDLERTARYYDLAMRATAAYLRRLPLAVRAVRLERLVEDFDGETQAVADFLGVGWSEALRDFGATARARAVRSRSAHQVGQGLNAKGVGKWRRYERALAPVLPILEPWIRRFGYE